MGHYKGQFKKVTGVGLAQVVFVITQINEGNSTIDKSWILLDTLSTHSVSNNPNMVTNSKL